MIQCGGDMADSKRRAMVGVTMMVLGLIAMILVDGERGYHMILAGWIVFALN